MRRLLLAFTVVFAVGGTCMSGGEEEEKEEEKDPVVVPVTDDDDDDKKGEEEEYWCCEYKDDAGTTQYALVSGPSECNTDYGPKEGRYISGNQCIPCCCKSQKDAEDAEKGHAFELTTPKSCVNASGECLAADAEECAGQGDGPEGGEDDKDEKSKSPTRRPTQRPTRPRTVQPPPERR